ncbi:hypothetical protein FZEAL_9783 [Fusarium zealandicum]|uniref:Uncharacterized protein n=1 Tax=Fusarium zealandicum TaxID=1053134 RepID=A0A8H4U839_9HYPO|nr:hypothetical protein FZEAL_9783 [Fusarium zealandicum]
MLTGVLNNHKGLRVAFPGRKSVDACLELQRRSFAGAHGSRQLYNMSGGHVYEVDLLFRRSLSEQGYAPKLYDKTLVLHLPSLVDGETVVLIVPDLSWLMHRGMRDILPAFGKTVMNAHQEELAGLLRDAVQNNEALLICQDWAPQMVKGNMPDVVYSAVMAGQGDSGNIVRAFTEVAKLVVRERESSLDETLFWGESELIKNGRSSRALTSEGIIALTKFVVLEWSQELDYQLYHNLPLDLLII